MPRKGRPSCSHTQSIIEVTAGPRSERVAGLQAINSHNVYLQVLFQGGNQTLLVQDAHGLAKGAYTREDEAIGRQDIGWLIDLYKVKSMKTSSHALETPTLLTSLMVYPSFLIAFLTLLTLPAP